jgi:hypothetical protein
VCIAPTFLTSTLHGGEWPSSRPVRSVLVEAVPVPIYRRLNGPQSWSGRYGEEKNLLSLPEIEPRFLGLRAHSRVAIPTELSVLESRPTNYKAQYILFPFLLFLCRRTRYFPQDILLNVVILAELMSVVCIMMFTSCI